MAKKLSPVMMGFLFAAVFVTLLIINIINDTITDNITEEMAKSCSADAGFVGEQLERCIIKSKEGGKLIQITVADCGGCGKTQFGEDQLCLTGADKDFCEENIVKNSAMVNLRGALKGITNFATSMSTSTQLIVISVLFIIGFFVGGGKVKLEGK